MAKNLCTVKYVDDAGRNWAIWADKATIEVAGQGAKLGAAVTGGAYPPIPRWLKPRYVIVQNAAKTVKRRVTCYTNTCDAFSTPGTTLSMSPFRGSADAPVTFTTAKVGVSESRREPEQDDPTIS